MKFNLKRLLRPIPYIFTDKAGRFLAKQFSKKLKKEISEKGTDMFLDLLLNGMDLAFNLMKGFRKNIKDFKGNYLFKTKNNTVVSAAVFDNGKMDVKEHGIKNWDVMVTFKNAGAFRDFLFSKDQDILNSILNNEVEIDGNLNYIYKFGFMARDLKHRLRIP